MEKNQKPDMTDGTWEQCRLYVFQELRRLAENQHDMRGEMHEEFIKLEVAIAEDRKNRELSFVEDRRNREQQYREICDKLNLMGVEGAVQKDRGLRKSDFMVIVGGILAALATGIIAIVLRK